MRFNDISLTEKFISDYDTFPKSVKKNVDRRIADWAVTGCLPLSASAHRAHINDPDLWIIYVTPNIRLLARLKNSCLVCERLFDHSTMMGWFFD